MPSSPPRTKAEQRAATRRRLIAVARELFARHGYAHAPTEEIVRRAGLTRGALYHHFGSKEGLFAAVLDDVQRDIAARVEAAALGESDPWEQLRAGCHAFLKAALDPDTQRIVLLDAPAVLGWETWRAADAAHGVPLLRVAIDGLVAGNLLVTPSPEAITHLLSGAMNEAALWVAQSEATEPALAAAIAALDQLLVGLRYPPRIGGRANPPTTPPRLD